MPVTDPAARTRFMEAVRFNEQGLIPVIAQAAGDGEVLMMAWMNAEALEETLATGRVVYFSRSRNALWRKGETSGQVQHWSDLRLDCDGDTILALVKQKGVACHTGRRSCFFQALREGELTAITAPEADPAVLYGR
ncbi:phosphoribosyl-AMP cyclohydrolase [Pseudoroseomonas globiformis]|uniref:Phosphoribosyl-AMP cyclohydrolase n=1 Tax=Teichococcus globiformis TaxID=2307229 RepID=A0ABV7FZ23_9PROT